MRIPKDLKPKRVQYGFGKGKNKLTYDADEILVKETNYKGSRQEIHSVDYHIAKQKCKDLYDLLKDAVKDFSDIETQEYEDYKMRNMYKK
jgi:hypothetical protein